MNIDIKNVKFFDAFTRSVIAQCIEELKDSEFALPLDRKEKALRVLKVFYRKRGRSNVPKAGNNVILMNLAYWQLEKMLLSKEKTIWIKEYNSFDKDREIGGFTLDSKDIVTAYTSDILHELSHFIQYNLYYGVGMKTWSIMRKPHGNGFKSVYRYLRNKYFNDVNIRNAFVNKHKEIVLGKTNRTNVIELPENIFDLPIPENGKAIRSNAKYVQLYSLIYNNELKVSDIIASMKIDNANPANKVRVYISDLRNRLKDIYSPTIAAQILPTKNFFNNAFEYGQGEQNSSYKINPTIKLD